MKQNTRIAPSPTGYFHVGTARTAYHNWLVARSTGGSFTLRIDDTDKGRSNDDFVKVIYDGMDWLGLDYDKTFKQSDRSSLYSSVAKDLLAKGLAHYTDDGAVILKPKKFPGFWVDTVLGNVRVTQDDIDTVDGMVILRSDGSPVYNFASVIDDIESGINRVIRGVDHIKNTARQVTLTMAILDTPRVDVMDFTHVGLIHEKSGKKVSKRDGALSVLDYRDQGIHPDALLNFLFRMGWSPSLSTFDSQHKFVDKLTATRIVNTDGKFNSSPSKIDIGKLNYYDKVYKRKSIGSVG